MPPHLFSSQTKKNQNPNGNMPDNQRNVEDNLSHQSETSEQMTPFSHASDIDPTKATDFSSSTSGEQLEEQKLEHTVENVLNPPQSSSEIGQNVKAADKNTTSDLPGYVDSSEEEYDPEESIDKGNDDEQTGSNVSKTVIAESSEKPVAPTITDAEAPISNLSAVSSNSGTPTAADFSSQSADVNEVTASTLSDKTSNGQATDDSISELKDLTSDSAHSSKDDTTEVPSEVASINLSVDETEALGNAHDAENDDEDEDYDPEAIAPPKEETNKANETTLTELSAADKLKEAYEAVMQSDMVRLEAFAKLSQVDQMAAIQKLLEEKNVALPTLSAQNPTPDSNSPVGKTRPDLSQPMSAEERIDYEKFLNSEPEYSNWETLDKFPSGLRLFIGNLFNNSQLKEELFRILNFYGDVIQITIKLGYGFAQFKTAEQAQNCVNGEKDIPFQGRLLRFNVSYGHKTPHGQVRGRDRFDEGGNDQKKFRGESADVQIFVTDGGDEEFGKSFRNSLRNANLTYNARTLNSTETSEEMVEAAYLGSIGACIVNGSKLDLQVFQESADGGVKFDEYLGVEPSTVCELLDKAKQQKMQKNREQGQGNYSQRPHSNDGGRPNGQFRPNYNYNGRGNFRNKYGNQTWHRGQDGNGPNNNYQKGNWKQNQGYNKPYNNYNQGGNNFYNGNNYNNNNGGNFNRPNDQFNGYQGNAGAPNMNNPNNFGPGYQGQNNAYNPNNNYGQYQAPNYQMNANTAPAFNAPAPAAQFPYQNPSVPPTGGAVPQMAYPPQSGGMPNVGYGNYPMPSAPAMGGAPMQPMYGQPSAPPQQPETSSALMDMLAKLGRK